MSIQLHLRGSTLRCPKCGSRKLAFDPHRKFKSYGPGLAACMNCETLWEPFEPTQILETSNPHCSFREPCNNCAFRTGSPEQADNGKWKELIDQLKCGGSFYCHKGIPIEPEAEHGFAYPQKTIDVTIDGVRLFKAIIDEKKLRLCRGYLNALDALHRAYLRESKSGKLDVLSIVGDCEALSMMQPD